MIEMCEHGVQLGTPCLGCDGDTLPGLVTTNDVLSMCYTLNAAVMAERFAVYYVMLRYYLYHPDKTIPASTEVWAYIARLMCDGSVKGSMGVWE